jgi:hypothetical protein
MFFFSFIIFTMCTVDETFKKFYNEGSTSRNVLEILKEIMPSSSFLPNECFNLHSFGFSPITPYITPSLTINVSYVLLWSTNGDDIYVQCTKLHESTINFSINKLDVDSTQFHHDTNKPLFHSIVFFLKQLVILLRIFSTLTLVCIWKTLISFPMPFQLHMLLFLIVRFLFS